MYDLVQKGFMKCEFKGSLKVNRISRDEVVGVPVPTYPQSKNQLSDTSLNWFYSANEKITIRGERLIEIEQSANNQFKNVERLRKV